MALSGQTTCRRCGDLGKVGGGNPDAFVDLPPDEVIDVADIPLKELPEVLGGDSPSPAPAGQAEAHAGGTLVVRNPGDELLLGGGRS